MAVIWSVSSNWLITVAARRFCRRDTQRRPAASQSVPTKIKHGQALAGCTAHSTPKTYRKGLILMEVKSLARTSQGTFAV